MAADQAPRSRQSSLVAVLGLAVVALLIVKLWPSAESPSGSSNPAGETRAQTQGNIPAPAALDVRLPQLEGEKPAPDDAGRNLFRFQPKPPPPPPPQPVAPPNPGPTLAEQRAMFTNGRGATEPQVPPIPLKFIGRLDSPSTGVVAIFTDSNGHTPSGKEGQIIFGQYRIVKIGVESVVIEYADGKGRTTLPLRGQ